MSFYLPKKQRMIHEIKEHWDYVHTDKSKRFTGIGAFFLGRQNYEFFAICKKYLAGKNYKNIFEVGCAPGNYLISFFKRFGYIPYGIDYSEQGAKKTQENLKAQHIPGEIWQQDFFDNAWCAENTEKYDVVFSLGFIEHYDDPSDAIARHFQLTKPSGTVIFTIPNLHNINSFFVPKAILDIHNRTIMDKPGLEKLFANYTVEYMGRAGGPINVGLYFYKNKFLETIRLWAFAVQRIILDPILILLYKLGIKVNIASAPQWMIICRK